MRYTSSGGGAWDSWEYPARGVSGKARPGFVTTQDIRKHPVAQALYAGETVTDWKRGISLTVRDGELHCEKA